MSASDFELPHQTYWRKRESYLSRYEPPPQPKHLGNTKINAAIERSWPELSKRYDAAFRAFMEDPLGFTGMKPTTDEYADEYNRIVDQEKP